GTGDTDVIVKPYAWSSTFSHGDATEAIGLAMEDGFVEVELPATFQGIALWPTEVEPNEIFDVTFWLRNDSEIASHNNVFNLELPDGWTLISGTDTQNVGSAQAGGITSMVNYTLRAPPAPAVGATSFSVRHSHTSYLEEYGEFNWNLGITVAVDNTPPNPNPMVFTTLPDDVSTTSMDMLAAFASDIHDPIEYYLDYTSSPSGGLGGTDSGWQPARAYTDSGLGVNDEYCYRAWARDNANFRNNTTPSASACAYTRQNTPSGVSFGAVTTTSIALIPTGSFNNLTLDLSGVRVSNVNNGDASPWAQNTGTVWTSVALNPAATYSFRATARNGDGDLTLSSSTQTRATLANPPAVDGLFPNGETEIKVSLNNNGNSNQAEYLIQNTTTGVGSGWISELSYSFEGLACGTSFNFQARARNPDGVQTIIVPLGQQSTDACTVDTDGDGITDSADNCTLIANADQRDTNGDGFGNACDADLNNDNIVNAVDLGLFRTQFFMAGDIDADFNGDLIVNAIDLGILRVGFFAPPGPSGTAP
ncbi:MAG: thrombospondin type 3 repeat-containing protein, partial [Gammaproteobacteria bacterium]